MDILFIADFCGGLDGQGNNRFLYLANMLCKEHEVEILTSDFNHGKKAYFSDLPSDFPFKVTMVHEGQYRKNVSLHRLYGHWIWAKNVQRYLDARKKPDIVYAAVPPLMAAYLAAKYCENNGIRFIIDIQDLWPEAFKTALQVPIISSILLAPFHFLANGIYKHADKVIAVSNTYVSRALQANDKCKSGLTVFLGTELKAFDKNARENAIAGLNDAKPEYCERLPADNKGSANGQVVKQKDEVWIAYIGNLGNHYDLDTVFSALSKLNDGKLKFIVMGDGERKKAFEKNPEGLNCVFTGRLPYSQMCGMLAACDIAVNPIRKGSCQSIINKHADYAAAGLPVLNTQECVEYKELVDSYHMGFNCECENAEDLADKLKILANNEKLREEMGKNARRCAEDWFDRGKTYRLICKAIVE